MNNRILLTCLTLCLSHTVLSAPLETSTEKSGAEEAHPATSKSVNLEEKVKEAVQKAELDAGLAAQDAMKHGHKAESRVESIKESAEPSHEGSDQTGEDKPDQPVKKHTNLVSDIDEGPHVKRVKEHKVNRKPGGMGKMMGLGELGDLAGNNNEYKEDTRLEDRLALEAEEEKKYETGEGYGGGGGGGGGAGWEDSGKGVNWATNIQRQDAAEKQSIQAQVASESAHELDEIQRAIAAESQSSRGSASIGNGGASVVGGAPGMAQQEGVQPRISSQEEGRPMNFVGGQQKGISSSENQGEFQEYASPYASEQSSFVQPEISSLIHQADKMMPTEMRGTSQQSNMELGSLGARGTQSLNGGMGGFGGLEGAQQLGGQSQATAMEQVPLGGSERAAFGGAMETAGAMGQEALGQAALGGGGRLGESAESRMAEGSLGGGASLQGMQSVQGIQGMTSAYTGGQDVQGGMLSDGGGVSALQGQGMLGGGLQSSSLQGGGLQGGLQSMMGGAVAGLPSMGGGAEFGQQQMSFKKSTIARPSDFQRSKTHQKEETNSKHNKKSQEYNKDTAAKSSLPKKQKTVPEKKSKLIRRQHSKHSKTL